MKINLLLLKQLFYPYDDLFNEEELNRIWIAAINKFKISDNEAIDYLAKILKEKIKIIHNEEYCLMNFCPEYSKFRIDEYFCEGCEHLSNEGKCILESIKEETYQTLERLQIGL